MAKLPSRIYGLAEYTPSIEVGLAILRDAFPDVNVASLVPDRPADELLPLIFVRDGISGAQGPQEGLVAATLNIDVFTMSPTAAEAAAGTPSGETQAALLSEAMRVAFREAWVNKRTYPGVATVSYAAPTQVPRYTADFATSAGPVQYADLPTGYWRYESEYRIVYRPLLNS